MALPPAPLTINYPYDTEVYKIDGVLLMYISRGSLILCNKKYDGCISPLKIETYNTNHTYLKNCFNSYLSSEISNIDFIEMISVPLNITDTQEFVEYITNKTYNVYNKTTNNLDISIEQEE